MAPSAAFIKCNMTCTSLRVALSAGGVVVPPGTTKKDDLVALLVVNPNAIPTAIGNASQSVQHGPAAYLKGIQESFELQMAGIEQRMQSRFESLEARFDKAPSTLQPIELRFAFVDRMLLREARAGRFPHNRLNELVDRRLLFGSPAPGGDNGPFPTFVDFGVAWSNLCDIITHDMTGTDMHDTVAAFAWHNAFLSSKSYDYTWDSLMRYHVRVASTRSPHAFVPAEWHEVVDLPLFNSVCIHITSITYHRLTQPFSPGQREPGPATCLSLVLPPEGVLPDAMKDL